MTKVVKFPTKKCESCGHPVLISAPVCTHCGSRLDTPPPNVTVPAAPPISATPNLTHATMPLTPAPTTSGPTYRLTGADGVEYGPVDMPALMQWIREGRVQPDSRIKEVSTGRQLFAREMPAFRAMYNSYSPSSSLMSQLDLQKQTAFGTNRIAHIHKIWPAILLAVLLTGAGQIYNRQIVKGLGLLLCMYLLGNGFFGFYEVLFLAQGNAALSPAIFLTIFAVAIWVLGIADAIIIASRLERGEPVSPWKFF